MSNAASPPLLAAEKGRLCTIQRCVKLCLLEEAIKSMELQVDPQAEPGQSEAPYFLPCLQNVLSAHHSHSGNYSKDMALRD